ncbi:hypothetical protein EXIGLDRAFT_202050 [Exidia glandulosa HHB12029]|uniref:Uncharacterized protein n=1 Tax=Exidia glandulosa HHB12029 TaxID=1314781 RepID=A0A165EPW6_EXIGL|nr:hypothetical protein EXIGLDRAFT_202050 [Exidia glandulosa HHB12029]
MLFKRILRAQILDAELLFRMVLGVLVRSLLACLPARPPSTLAYGDGRAHPQRHQSPSHSLIACRLPPGMICRCTLMRLPETFALHSS